MEKTNNVCWILSDGTAGMEIQAIALAEALNIEFQLKPINPSTFLRIFPQFGALPGLSAHKDSKSTLGPPFPKILITCGRRHAGAAIALKRMSKGKIYTIHIQDPRISPSFFDSLIIPEHDPSRSHNVITSKGSLNKITPVELDKEAQCFSSLVENLPDHKVAVNIGGDSGKSKVTHQTAKRIVNQLRLFADTNRCGLMITTSRRTNHILKEELNSLSGRQDMVIWGSKSLNPYVAFLALADTIIVTSDSINMISEACSTGKPVYVLPMGSKSTRREKFLSAMEVEGRIKTFDGSLQKWDYLPLQETKRVAKILRQQIEDKNII